MKPCIYIAGPMTGLPDSNYPTFNKAAAAWRAAGWHVFNPAESFGGDATLPYKYYAEHDMVLLRCCVAIALLPGWDSKTARGSVWEYEIARTLLDIPVFDAMVPMPPEALGVLASHGLTKPQT